LYFYGTRTTEATSMNPARPETFSQRFLSCLFAAWKPAITSSAWLLKITLPVSFAFTVLNHYGIIEAAAVFLNPLFTLIGLPGQSGLVYISSLFLNIYSAIAAMTSLPFTMREETILALMCLIAHNIITETIVQKKTGSSAVQMVVIRIAASIVAAMVLNLVLPASLALEMNRRVLEVPAAGIFAVMKNWVLDSALLAVKILLIVNGLLLLQKVLKEFNLYDRLAKVIAPLISIMGLPVNTVFLWIVGNSIGLTYGGAIMVDAAAEGALSKTEVNLLNVHLGISHALLEDTLLFLAIGIPVFWILVPRLALAMAVVWLVRLLLFLKNRGRASASGRA
jgi:hypothetical protein